MQVGDEVTLLLTGTDDMYPWNRPELVGVRGRIKVRDYDPNSPSYLVEWPWNEAWWYYESQLEYYNYFERWVQKTRREAGLDGQT